LAPAVAAARAPGFPGAALMPRLPGAAELLAQAATLLPPQLLDPQLVARATPALEQLGTVLGEVGDGVTGVKGWDVWWHRCEVLGCVRKWNAHL